MGVLSGAGPSEPRGGASGRHQVAGFIWSPPTSAVGRSLMFWELVVGGPGAALSSAWLPILFPWLALGLLG